MEIKKTKLLIHICCEPDAVYAVPSMRNEYDLAGFFFNPNIHPKEEYEKRLSEVKRMSNLQKWELIVGDYNIRVWFDKIKEHKWDGEYSERCRACIKHSLTNTARFAKENNYDLFATTLTNSPRKKIEMLDEIGNEVEREIGIKYLHTNFKKKNGYLKSIKMSKVLNIYRQNYCGCIYSKIEKEQSIGGKYGREIIKTSK
ncbi:epoxyqueuosine reductase QueH [bacterium]|nr:epoxyqueuosine reductase QueH [bacterium]